MAVTITSEDERASVQLDAEVPRDAKRLVLVDTDGREHHFGCGVWTPNGTFIHVATYTAQGRAPYAWWHDIREGLDRGFAIRDEPELGPLVSPLANVALTGLARRCTQVNGFHAEPEKKWAIETLRALWEEAREPLDVDEAAVWVVTHGWALKDAKKFRDLAEGVRNGTKFRGTGQRAISRDHDRERKMVAHWREQLAT